MRHTLMNLVITTLLNSCVHISLYPWVELSFLTKFVKIFYTTNPFPYIKQADIFLLSSQYEGLPNVLLESIALKKFVISSKSPVS